MEAKPPHQPETSDQREWHREHDNERLGHAPEIKIEQQEDDKHRDRHHDLQPSFGALQIFELAAPSDVMPGRKLDLCGDGLLRVRHVAAKITVAQIDENVGSKLGVFGADAGGSLRKADLGDLAERNRASVA